MRPSPSLPPLPLRRDCRCACHRPGAHILHVVPCCRCPHGSRAVACPACDAGSGAWLALGAVGALAAVTTGLRVYRDGFTVRDAVSRRERLEATGPWGPGDEERGEPVAPVRGRTHAVDWEREIAAGDPPRGSRATPGAEWMVVGLHSRERWRERVPSTKRGYVARVAEAMADRNDEPVEVYRVSISSTRPVSWTFPLSGGRRVTTPHLGDVSLMSPAAYAQARREALGAHAVSQQSRAKNTAKRCPLLVPK